MKRLIAVLASALIASGCVTGGGGGGGGTPPPSGSLSVTISPSTQSAIDAGQRLKFTATLENDATGKGVTWSASAPGLAGSAAGTFTNTTADTAIYNAPASVAANLRVTVTATPVADTTKPTSAVVVVSPPPAIGTTGLPAASPNATYTTSLSASGGAGALTWSLAAGGLPTGLALTAAGEITGDPTASGTAQFTVQVTDSSAASPLSVEAQLSLTVVSTLSIGTTSLPAGAEGVPYVAPLEADGGESPYVWSATAPLPAGLTLEPNSGVIAGYPTAQGTFTLTLSVHDSSPTAQTQTAQLALAIGVPQPLAITTAALLDATTGAPYRARLAATGGYPPYTWAVQSGSLPTGTSLASSGVISGTPTEVETATFTASVTDSGVTPSVQTQSLSLAVTNPAAACGSAGSESQLSGPFVFSLSGFNNVGFLTVVGAFTADGAGKITAGEADTNGVLGAQNGGIVTSGSSYSLGANGLGCATLATPFGTFGVHFALGTTSSPISGGLIEWDSPSASAYVASGQILAQSTALSGTVLNGSYAFQHVGWDPASLGGRDVCVGAVTATGNGFSGFEQDCNDNWALSNTAADTVSGAYTAFDAHGRATGILALADANSAVAFYAVSPSRLLVVNADSGPFLGGEWDQQTVPAGSSGFTSSALSGNAVFHLDGLSLEGTASAVSIDLGSADGAGTINLTYYEDRAGTMQVPGTYTCTYEVEPNGRVTLSSSTQACGATTPVLYLTGLNRGFILAASPGVDQGSFEPQQAGPFNNASLAGQFFGGMGEVVTQNVQSEADPVSSDGAGDISGLVEMSSESAQVSGSALLLASYNVNANGTFTLSATGDVVAGILISNSKFVMFSPATATLPQPTLLVVEK